MSKIIQYKVFIVLFGVVLLNVILKLLYIDFNDIARDEPFSMFVAQMSPQEIVNYLKGGNNPPLYELFLHYWIKITGLGVFSVRLPSLIFSSLSAGVIFLIGKRLFGFASGLFSSLIFSFTTIHTYYAHEARVYPLFVLLSLLSFLFQIKYFESNKKTYLISLVIVDISVIYAHYFGFFILLNQFISFVIFRRKVRKELKYILFAVFFIFLAYTPMIHAFFSQFFISVQRGTWVLPPLVNHYYGFLNYFVNNKFASIVLIVFGFIQIFLLYKSNQLQHIIRGEKSISIRLVFLWFFVPYTIMFLASFKAPMFIERYVLFTSVFLYLFIGAFMMMFTYRKVFQYIIVLTVIFVMVFSYDIKPSNNRHISDAVNYVKDNKKDDALILFCPAYDFYAFTYHYDLTYFKDYSKTLFHLENDNIFGVSSLEDLQRVLGNSNYESIIYFQSISAFVDPENEIFNKISSIYKLTEKRNFFEIYCVTIFHRINE